MMKYPIAVLLASALIMCLFAGCQKPVDSEGEIISIPEITEEVESEAEPVSESAEETLHPISHECQWLYGGNLLAVPDGNVIRYINLENELAHKVQLTADMLLGEYQYLFDDNRILVMGKYDFGGRGSAGNLSACLSDGEWVLTNGSIWDYDGNLLQEFSSLELLSDDPWSAVLPDGHLVESTQEYSSLEIAHWISDDLLALDGHSRLFLYRLSTDTLTLVDDMSEWMDEFGKLERVYLGLGKIMPAQARVCFQTPENAVKTAK